jgi:hypothetical protein
MEEPPSCPYTRGGPHPKSFVMTEHHPTFFLAVVVGVLTAVALRLVGVPGPWPAAVSLYVYGAVAWPVLRERMPVRPAVYAAVWVSAALLVVVYETLAPAVR